jgi:hypothetical protein
MLRPVIVLAINGLLFTGVAEALLHLLAGAGPAVDALHARSSLLGSLAVAPNLLCLALLLFVEGLPSWRLALVSLANLWVAYGAAPLFLWVPESVPIDWVWGTLLLAQVAVVLAWVLAVGGRPWLLSSDLPGLRLRRRRQMAAIAVVGVVLGPPVIAGYAAVALLSWVQLATSAFVSFDLAGVNLGDRRYARGDEQVRLVGMMHVGERHRYRDLVRSFVTENTVVLYEGVTDDEGLVDSGLDYGGAASALGLEAQHDLRDYLGEIEALGVSGVSPAEWPVLRHADLDMSELSESTREFVAQAASLWGSESLVEAFSDYLVWYRAQDEAVVLSVIQDDLIERRNAHLLAQISVATQEFDFVVAPWGALHLPGLERALLESGFSELERGERRLLFWLTLLGWEDVGTGD